MQPKCVSDVQMCICAHAKLLCLTRLPFSFLIDKKLHILSRPAGSDGPRDAPRSPVVEEVTEEGEASPTPGTPKFTPQNEGGSNNILAYVSVLAAVVLGLLLYVAYKW